MPAGQPTKYSPEYVERARELCEAGATDVELAEEFDVSVSTLYNWRSRHPEFLEALKASKDVADQRVERTLYRRAVEGDTTSMIFWLKNRKSAEWRDRTPGESADNPLAIQLISSVPRPPKE